VLERGIHGNFQPAGAQVCTFFRDGDPIRDDDELRQYRYSSWVRSLITLGDPNR
jgi:hypothetical protein